MDTVRIFTFRGRYLLGERLQHLFSVFAKQEPLSSFVLPLKQLVGKFLDFVSGCFVLAFNNSQHSELYRATYLQFSKPPIRVIGFTNLDELIRVVTRTRLGLDEIDVHGRIIAP